MSIIAAAFTKEIFYIATDTLTSISDKDGRTPFPGSICNFSTKITYYPHLKCCVVILGNSQLALDHDKFIICNYFEDIEDLYNQTAGKFDDNIKPSDYVRGDNLIGGISIMGYNEASQEMEAYQVMINVDKTKKAFKTDIPKEKGGIANFMAPRLAPDDEAEIWENCNDDEAGLDIVKVLIDMTKKMHDNSLYPETYHYPVGGELNFTIMGVVDGQFICNNSIMHRFHDYEDNKRRIKLLRTQMDIVDEHKKLVKKLEELQDYRTLLDAAIDG